jgi:proline iminopeptidase
MRPTLSILLLSFLALSGCSHARNEDQEGSLRTTGSITVDGSKLNYVVEGKGKPCLVIGSSVYYPKTFSKKIREHLRIYFVDMKWFAENYAPESLDAANIGSIVDDVEEIRSKLGLNMPVIMGHSIHGTIAMEYVKRYSNKASALVIIGSPPQWGNPVYDQKAAALWDTASEERKGIQNENWGHANELSRLTGKEEAATGYHMASPQYWYDPRYDARWLWDGMTVHSELTKHLFTRVFANYNMFEEPFSIPTPVLVCMGKYDYVIPHTLWESKYVSIPDFTFVLFDKSGHTPQLEESELFDQRLIKWLTDKVGKQRRSRLDGE